MNRKLNKAILVTLGTAALAGVSTQASAINPTNLGIFTGTTLTNSNTAPYRAFSDYGTSQNYGWTHTAKFLKFQVGTTTDITAGTRFDVNLELKAGVTNPMSFPGFAVWTSGGSALTNPVANNYGHMWSPARGPRDGGVGGDPGTNATPPDASLGTNGWMGSYGGGNIVTGRDGWVGYANAGYSFTNGDGDKIQGLLAGTSNPSNVGEYFGGATLLNYNNSSPYVSSGSAILSSGDAMLSLFGLKAGYYLVGLGGACPDENGNGQDCNTPTTPANRSYTFTVSSAGTAVPIPAAVWLFGSALAGLGVFGRRKSA